MAADAVDRLSKLLLDNYVETDEEIGPRVRSFEQSEKQLQLVGEQLTTLRDVSSAVHAAHMQLSTLSVDGNVPSLRTYGEQQSARARLAQKLAAQYERFVTISVNQLEGLSLVVANKYKAYCNKVVEERRRKAQLQLLMKQKERSDLRTLERSLIPATPGEFHDDLKGPLVKQSTATGLWWSTYARLDIRRKCLLFTSKESDPPSKATQAVALCKYGLAHELPEHHVRRAAAFELVPLLPELPIITLAADGTMASRRWVCALQQAIDRLEEEGEAAATMEASGSASSPAAPTTDSKSKGGDSPEPDALMTPPPMPAAPPAAADTPTASPFQPIAKGFEQMVVFSASKIAELDRSFSGTLAEQSQRTEVQLAQLVEEKKYANEVATKALEEFSTEMNTQMSHELLCISQAELEYHQSMVTHLQQVVSTLKLPVVAAADSVVDDDEIVD